MMELWKRIPDFPSYWEASNHGRVRVQPRVVVTAPQVRDIRSRVAAGETRTSVASDLDVSLSTISLICSRKRYGHVE